MFKNFNSNQITALQTITLGLFNSIIVVVTCILLLDNFNWFILAFVVFSLQTVIYILNSYLLNNFVFRKIRLIYKVIRREQVENFENTDLNIVKNEVEQWVEKTKGEKSYLLPLEAYKKNFVSNLSHELNTPIFSIQGYLYTLLEGGLYDKSINKKYLKRAAANIDRLAAIVEDLNMINKLESDTLDLDIRSFDIKSLVKEVLLDLELYARSKEIDLGFLHNASRTFKVLADKELIRQVLNNLITNSIKYGINNGNTRISFYDMDSDILIEVADNGIGIAPQHLNHIFDRFYRADASRSRKLGGSGLGLSIVKHLVEAHHKTVNVRSTPEVGTTFSFTLSKANK